MVQEVRQAITRVPIANGRTGLPKGTVLAKRYQITHVIGLGGMSTVYAARDLRFANTFKPCAVKEMAANPQGVKDPTQLQQTFEREANLLASLSHPAIPKVYDYFANGDQLYLVLEFISGKDMESVLNASRAFIPQETVVSYALQILDVLSYLHNHKPVPIVFRDLKPSNVMLTDQDRVMLIDFGIAKAYQNKTMGTMIGTEGYCPPEQYRGLAEPRGDLYSLGALMHQMLTRSDPRLEVPFTFAERLPTKLNPAVSKAVEDVILRAVAYQPEDRFPTAADMRAALELCLARPARGTRLVPGATEGLSADAQLRLRWRFNAEDEIRSTPCVHNGMVYVGAYDNNLYAIDTESGKLRWKFATEGGIPSSPVLDNDILVFGSEDKNVYALNVTQHAVQWMFPTQAKVRSSARLTGDACYIGSDDGHLHALDLASGTERWRFRTWKPLRCQPYVHDDLVYTGSEDTYIYGIDLLSGSLRWKVQTLREITSSPIVVDGFMYIGSMDGHLYCLDAAMGWQIWKFKTAHYILGAPRAAHGFVYVGSADQNLYAIESKTGKLAWKFASGGQISSTPALHGDLLFFTCVDQKLYCVHARTGKLMWRFRSDGVIAGSPAVQDRTVYFGANDGALYAISID